MDKIIYENGEKIISECDITEVKDKVILITGVSGLFGVHFMYSLVVLMEKMKIFPKKIIGVHYSSLPEYLIDLVDYDNIEFIKGDLTDLDFCNTLPQSDIIIHAATYGQPKKFLNNQISAFKLNTSTTNALLDKLNEDGKFLFASSCAVYSGGGERTLLTARVI